MAAAAAKAGVTVERIVNELAKIGLSDIRRALDWGMKQTEDGPVPYPDLLKKQEETGGIKRPTGTSASSASLDRCATTRVTCGSSRMLWCFDAQRRTRTS